MHTRTLVTVLLVVAWLLCPSSARAHDRWRTADGKLYFGISPPLGSVPADVAPKPAASVPSDKPPAAPPKRAQPPASRASVQPNPAPAVSVLDVDVEVLGQTISARGFTTCLENHGSEAKRAWVVTGERRFLIGITRPGRVDCLGVNTSYAAGDPAAFRIETEPAPNAD